MALLNWIMDNVKKIITGAVILIIVTLIGYAIYYLQPIDGTVIDKYYIPAHSEIRYSQSCTTTTVGKTTVRNCVSIPYTVSVPDNWSIKVCNEKRCKEVAITQIRYQDTQIGNHFSEKN